MSMTSFGRFMKIQRIKKNEVMGDTAKLLGVTIPYISAVENGKRNVPEEWLPKLIKHYELTNDEQEELKKAVEELKTQVKITLNNATNYQRQVVFQLERSFDNLDEETANEIMKLLNPKEKK